RLIPVDVPNRRAQHRLRRRRVASAPLSVEARLVTGPTNAAALALRGRNHAATHHAIFASHDARAAHTRARNLDPRHQALAPIAVLARRNAAPAKAFTGLRLSAHRTRLAHF